VHSIIGSSDLTGSKAIAVNTIMNSY
jgi:hypothetical protein